jgi:hypothetical protein
VTADASVPPPIRQPVSSRLGPYAAAVLAGAAGFGLNQFGVTVLGGTEVVFGGLLSLLIAFRFGGLPGGLTALIAFSAVWARWGHPMGVICYTGEALVVGWLIHQWRMRPLLAIVGYWALVGVPAVALYMWRDTSMPFPSYIAIVVKYPLNTVLIVGPALSLLDLPFFGGAGRERPWVTLPAPLRRIVSDRFALFAVVPLVVLALIFGHLFDQTLRERAAESLGNDARNTAFALAAYLSENRRAIETQALLWSGKGPPGTEAAYATLETLRMTYPSFLTLLAADQR